MRTLPAATTFFLLLTCAVAATGCVAEDVEQREPREEDDDVGAQDEAVRATPGLRSAEMKLIATPPGFPKAWSQPDSDGWFDERGKCGPTAVANLLRLYGRDGISPDDAYEGGVRWVVGSRPVDLSTYLQRTQRDLGCRTTYAPDGPALIRAAVQTDRPLLAWFRTEGLTSHWVAISGVRGEGANEKVILLSWGRYYEVPMARFAEAWASVYGFRNPAIVCTAKSSVLAASP